MPQTNRCLRHFYITPCKQCFNVGFVILIFGWDFQAILDFCSSKRQINSTFTLFLWKNGGFVGNSIRFLPFIK